MRIEDKDNLHYLVLLLGVSVLAFFFVFFKHNTPIQTLIALLGCIYYVLWGIMHHALKGRLLRIIVLEYTLVGSIIFLLLFTSLSV